MLTALADANCKLRLLDGALKKRRRFLRFEDSTPGPGRVTV
jgi:hypothetical protein